MRIRRSTYRPAAMAPRVWRLPPALDLPPLFGPPYVALLRFDHPLLIRANALEPQLFVARNRAMVVGLDVQPNMIDRAQQRFAKLCGDLRAQPRPTMLRARRDVAERRDTIALRVDMDARDTDQLRILAQ